MLSKTPATEVDQTEAAKPSEVQKKVPATALKKYLKDMRAGQSDVDEVSGRMGQLTSNLTNKYSVNRQALSLIKRLDKKEPEKLADFLDDFLYMLDISGLSDRAKTAPRLLGDEGSGSEEE